MDTISKKVLDIVQLVRTGAVRLPQFQRSFVWSRQEVADLLTSLLNGYYIGTFLWLPAQGKELPFGDRLFEGVEQDSAVEDAQFLILDGQQRLTSLYYALYAPSNTTLKNTSHPYRFYLALDKLPEEENAPISDDAVFSERSDHKKYKTPESQYEARVIPFTQLPGGKDFDWLFGYSEWARERDQEARKHVEIWRRHLKKFLDQTVPVVALPAVEAGNARGLDHVATVFEKINSTGRRLSVFDLLTARLYPNKINLRHLWEHALQTHEHLKRFVGKKKEEYAVYALRTLALYRGQDARGKRLINLEAEGFENDWELVTRQMDEAARRIESVSETGFGAFKRSWVPYSTMISALAMLLWRAKNIRAPSAYEKVQRWYWASVFTERYGGSVETLTMQDYKEVSEWMQGKDVLPDAIRKAQDVYHDISSGSRPIRDTSTTGKSIFRGTLSLLALRSAKDFFLGDAIAFHDLDVHHIFPVGFLKRRLGIQDTKLINSLANQTLIAAETNRAISNKAPSVYLKDLEEKHGDNLPRLLQAHFIDEKALEAMRSDDYIAFIDARSRAIAREVARRVGIE